MNRHHLAPALAALFLTLPGAAVHGEIYDYCVTRVAPDSESVFRVRFATEDAAAIGRDTGAILVARHFRDAQAPRVRIGAFDPLMCPAEPILDLAYSGRDDVDPGVWNPPPAVTPAGVIREASALASTVYEAPFRALGRALTSASETANRAVCRIVSC